MGPVPLVVCAFFGSDGQQTSNLQRWKKNRVHPRVVELKAVETKQRGPGTLPCHVSKIACSPFSVYMETFRNPAVFFKNKFHDTARIPPEYRVLEQVLRSEPCLNIGRNALDSLRSI